jgi:hypothetical protein
LWPSDRAQTAWLQLVLDRTRLGSRLRATIISNRFDEETDEPLLADHRNYYKVEKWTKHGRVERMLYAGSNLGRAQSVFEAAIRHRPRIKLTIRQRTRVLKQWPEK